MREDGTVRPGTWARDAGKVNKFTLVTCPTGHELRAKPAVANIMQECFPCAPGQFILAQELTCALHPRADLS